MNLDALRKLTTRLSLAASAVISSVILGSCGGGGAASTNEVNGSLTLLPSAASLYAGVPYTFTIAGGRPPYLLSSSEPLLLPVPARVEGHTFQVVANNPGVIDANLADGSVPIRSVIITVRDSFGTVISTPAQNGITVAQNFFTGYGAIFISSCDTANACAGSDTIVRLVAVSNGVRFGNRAVRFCVVRGQFSFVIPEIPSNLPEQLVNCFDTVTDHTGVATARLRVPAGATSQLATLRVTDIATGVSTDEVFTIAAATAPTLGPLTILPNDFTFTGPRQGVCGTGSGDFLVFDGSAPYTAISSNPNISVTPSSTTANPGRFTITAGNPAICVANATIVVTDSSGRRATVTVKTEQGSGTGTALVVSPTTVTLNDTCGFTTSVTAVGGAGPLSVNSTHPRVSAVISGNTVTITRLTGDPLPLVLYPTTATVTVTDGATTQNVSVNNVRQSCP